MIHRSARSPATSAQQPGLYCQLIAAAADGQRGREQLARHVRGPRRRHRRQGHLGSRSDLPSGGRHRGASTRHPAPAAVRNGEWVPLCSLSVRFPVGAAQPRVASDPGRDSSTIDTEVPDVVGRNGARPEGREGRPAAARDRRGGEPAAIEPAPKGGRDLSLHRAQAHVAGAAMEPAPKGGRDDQRQLGIDVAGSLPQWSPPRRAGGTPQATPMARLPTSPQWSPPRRAGGTLTSA